MWQEFRNFDRIEVAPGRHAAPFTLAVPIVQERAQLWFLGLNHVPQYAGK